MSPPKSKATDASSIAKVVEIASTAADAGLDILETLAELTENVPYLNMITGVVKKLIEIHKVLFCCV